MNKIYKILNIFNYLHTPKISATSPKDAAVVKKTEQVSKKKQPFFHNPFKAGAAGIKRKLKRIKVDEEKQIFLDLTKPHSQIKTRDSDDLYKAVRYCNRIVSNGRATDEDKKQICKLLAQLGTLSNDLFDRHRALAGKKELQKLLSPELAALLDEQESNPTLAEDESYQLKLSMAKANLAVSLGCGMKPTANGQNGAQLVRSLEGKPIGIFKPSRSLKWYEFAEHLKGVFGQRRLLNTDDPLAEQYAEVAAYKFDKAFGFHMTPAAQMCQLRGEQGAFIAFVEDYKEAKDVIPELEKKKSYSDRECEIFQKWIMLDFATAGLDGKKDDNVFLRMKNGSLDGAIKFDFGNNFITDNPGTFGSKGNQHQWGELKIAQKKFTPKILEFISSMKKEQLEQWIQESRPEFITEGMKACLYQRLRVLKECVQEGKISTPKELAQLHTNADFERVLGKSQQPVQLETEVQFQEREDKDFDEFTLVEIY